MSFAWLTELLKNFDIPSRIAWMALLFGLGAFVFLHYNLLPAGELITQTAAWLLSWFGIVVISVQTGFGARDWIDRKLAAGKKAKEDRVAEERRKSWLGLSEQFRAFR